MQIFKEINDSNKNLSLAFGFFDGVHLGHQAVIKSAVNFSKTNGTKSAIVTFQDHPCCYFYNLKPKYILKHSDKIKMFENLGVDYLFNLKFDEYFAMMDASAYLKDVIIKNLAPSAISTGFNHFFGAKKTGNVDFLQKMQVELGYEYFEVKPLLYNGEVVSSTRIREDLAIGNMEMVNAMLGYNYFLEEKVVHGEELGRTIGFKTANLVYPNDLIDISRGVYKVKVEYDGNIYDAIANYGRRPTVSKDENSILEVHILNFDKEIYGEKIKVNFFKKIRDEKKFYSLEELKAQIQEDITTSQL